MYLNKLSASDIMELNKLNKEYNTNPDLTLEQKIDIKTRILEALEYQDRSIGGEVSKVRSEQRALYDEKHHLEDLASLEWRNYDWYTEKDKEIMSKLKLENKELYDILTLRLKIDFQKDVICIRWEGDRIAVDRKDARKFLWWEKFTNDEAYKLAKKEWKLLVASFFYDLVEHYEMPKELVIDMFDLKRENYWVRYHTNNKFCWSVIHSDNLWDKVPVKSNWCWMWTSWVRNINDLDKNQKANVRMFEVLEKSKWWSVTIIM